MPHAPGASLPAGNLPPLPRFCCQAPPDSLLPRIWEGGGVDRQTEVGGVASEEEHLADDCGCRGRGAWPATPRHAKRHGMPHTPRQRHGAQPSISTTTRQVVSSSSDRTMARHEQLHRHPGSRGWRNIVHASLDRVPAFNHRLGLNRPGYHLRKKLDPS